MANVYDNSGKLIGSTRQDGDGTTRVYNDRGQPAGETNRTGTWGNDSRKSSTADPGLLWKK